MVCGNNGNGQYSGHVRVFLYIKESSTWEQLGGDIEGEAANGKSGYAVDDI